MRDGEKKDLRIESLEITELEDADLDDIFGGGNRALGPNNGCPGGISPNDGCPGGVGPNNGCPGGLDN